MPKWGYIVYWIFFIVMIIAIVGTAVSIYPRVPKKAWSDAQKEQHKIDRKRFFVRILAIILPLPVAVVIYEIYLLSVPRTFWLNVFRIALHLLFMCNAFAVFKAKEYYSFDNDKENGKYIIYIDKSDFRHTIIIHVLYSLPALYALIIAALLNYLK